jgi:HK97 family phage portal protein
MMAENKRQPNLLERLLFGPGVNDGVDRKGLFQYEGTQYEWTNNYSGPTVPLNYAGTYGTRYDYSVEAGDLVDNTAVMACMLWVCRTFPEAPLVVKRLETDGTEKEVQRHAMAQKVRRPNPYYSGMLLWQATLLSFNWNGNAYWRKVRNDAGQVLALYYEPHWNMRPVRSSGDEFISRYQIWRDRRWNDIDRSDVVHFRYGIDPRNDMLGLSPLASALREVYTDNQAARYASSMFRNKGVLGGMVFPESEDTQIDNPEELKATLNAISTGDQVGSWGVFSTPLKFMTPDNDPSKMDTRGNRKITEERISALLGVPAIVAGLGAGLDRSTFANMAEAREAAYEGNIIPTQAMMADELDIQLLPDFGDADNERTDWDYSKVRVLQDDENKKATRWAVLFNAGLVKRGAALDDLGLPYDEADNVYKSQSAPPSSPFAPDTTQTDAGSKTLIDHETGLVKALSNGHGGPRGLLAEALADVKAKKKLNREQIEREIVGEVKAEIARVYEEAERKV